MLKLPKGLKKKKKDKKSKKNQELFTEEELAAYKQREQREKQDAAAAAAAAVEQQASTTTTGAQHQPAAGAASSSTAGAGAADDADEWRKFAALTSGIDTVLKKTQGNLDRLKESSFYQREPTKCEKEAEAQRQQAEAAAAAAAEAKRAALEAAAAEQAKRDADPLAGAVVELSESEEESEEADDIFDTTYIDELASRGVDLYVPDTPDEDFDAGPDPFDTDYAEKVIKGPEVSSRGKKLVHIGAAVEVLTGRVDKVAGASVVRRPRRGIQNLLLQSFDEGGSGAADGAEGAGEAVAEVPVQASLLDDIPDDIPGGPIDLSVSLHLQFIKPVEKKEEDTFEAGNGQTSIVSEFDVLKQDEEDEFDEFAELAAESLTAHKDVQVLTEVPVLSAVATVAEDGAADWASFQAEQGDGKKAKPPARPPPPKALVVAAVVAAAHIDPSEEFPTPDDADPFDTTFAERVLPLEDDFDFDPRADEPTTAPEPLNLLDEHITDEPHLAAPIVVQASIDQAPEIDPFDTSAIAAIVLPKAAEIQCLERELLGDQPQQLPHSLSDEDFDPRGGVAEAPPSTADLNRRKSSLSLNIAANSFPLKSVVFASDLLAVQNAANGAGGAKIQKPLTPYYAGDLAEEKEPDDPFDTSFVPPRKPSQVELTLLERDLLCAGGSTLNRSISDPDFDPRAVTPNVPTAGNADLLAVHEEHNIKVLTPAQNEARFLANADESSSLDAYNDPFDTSAVSQTILPGRAELKIIEDELLPQTTAAQGARVSVLDSCSDSQELGLGGKVLTPQIPFSAGLELEEQDPFDTSIANNLAPGQVEIKLLESELIHQ